MKGKYIAVGAGPCADLITLRGLNAITDADVVLYDRLADESILKESGAEKIFAGKEPYKCGIIQEEINDLLRKHLLDGKTVVRLKGGDSLVFSRVSEEIAVAKEAGADIEIIPGVTAASSAMARAQGALTDRISASGVMFITGHFKGDGIPAYDWYAIAHSGLTIVVYMGMKNIAVIAQNLIEQGLYKDTPALAADCVEQPDEILIPCTISELAKGTIKCKGPAVFVVGNVLKNAGVMQPVNAYRAGGCAEPQKIEGKP